MRISDWSSDVALPIWAGGRLHVFGLYAHVGRGHGGGTRLDCIGADHFCHMAAGARTDRCLPVWRDHYSYLSYAGAGGADSIATAVHAALSCNNTGDRKSTRLNSSH